MSFGDGNLHAAVDRQAGIISELAQLVRFMAAAMAEHGYAEAAPACWQHIERQMAKLGLEIPNGGKARK